MLAPVTDETARGIANSAFRRYAEAQLAVDRDFREAVASFGLDVSDEDEGAAEGVEALAAQGVSVENGGKSLHVNWISPACIACRTGLGTETFLTSVQCPRNCYFCFNVNQADYEFNLTHSNDIAAQLRERFQEGARYTCLGITGGEPLLHYDSVLDFLDTAAVLYPSAHTRLYTSGSGLDEHRIAELADAGLAEIRFSVKLDDAPAAREECLRLMGACVGAIPQVMVEMPVMPDEGARMEELLVRLDALGIDGINLLELCFPFNNAAEFARRGYRIKKRPYLVPYDYWYAGGLPIAGSERACLGLMGFAVREGLSLGVHYCSLENKLTGQVYQQNRFIEMDLPAHAQSPRDNFMKSAKVFGADRDAVRALLRSLGERALVEDRPRKALEFPVTRIPDLAGQLPDVEVCVCTGIKELRDGGPVYRVLALAKTTPATFDPSTDW